MDGISIVNPLLEKVMKETALDKVRQKFILIPAGYPNITEAIEELRRSMAFVDGYFRNGNFNKDAYVDIVENVLS